MCIPLIVTDDSCIELGCVEMMSRRLAGNILHFYIDPQRAGHRDAVKAYGLTQEFLADKPLFSAIADKLMEDLVAAEIIFDNAAVDAGFLDHGLRLLGRPEFVTSVAETNDRPMMASEWYLGKAYSLEAVCRRLEVNNSNRTPHTASVVLHSV